MSFSTCAKCAQRKKMRLFSDKMIGCRKKITYSKDVRSTLFLIASQSENYIW